MIIGIPHDAIVLSNSQIEDEFDARKIEPLVNTQFHKYPWEVEIHLTGNCNLNCKGCSYATRRNNSELNISDLRDILNSACEMDSHTVFFSGGGDPFFWKLWKEFEILAEYTPKKLRYGISSNFLGYKEHNVSMGLFDFVQIHIVGYDRDSCWANTGVDCFGLLESSLSMIDNFANVSFKVLIGNSTIDYLYKYLDYLINYPAKTIILKFAQNFLTNENTVTEKIYYDAFNMVKQHPITTRYLKLIDTYNQKMPMKKPNRCKIVDWNLYALIKENGLVYPCVASPYEWSNSIGSVHTKTLKEIYDNGFDKDKFSNNMILGNCPLYACRHYKFNQYLENRTTSINSHIFPDLL